VQITLRKAGAFGRHHTAEKRDVRAEAGAAAEDWLAAATAHEPGPAEAAMLVDQIESLLRDLPPLYCQILDLRLQGRGPSEIAPMLGISRQTVHRALVLLQRRLEAASTEPARKNA